MTNVVRLPSAGPAWMQALPWVTKGKGELDAAALMNARLMLEHHPAVEGLFTHDAFKDEIAVTRGWEPGDNRRYPRPLSDADDTALTCWLTTQGLSARITNTAALIREIALRSSYDPLAAWLRGLKWDGQPRVDGWLARCAGSLDDYYTRMVGRKFLIAAVARALRPGCKVDTMMVLEGEQGIKKSSLVRELASPTWFSDHLGDVRSKESAELIQGRWLIEVAEMDRVLRVESSAVKDFLSKQEDRYRPSYGRNVVTRPRRCVFIGTINPTQGAGYLTDPTGARRFWPVVCDGVDLGRVREEREQLWAEAVCLFSQGEAWWLDADESVFARDVQDERFDHDVWESRVVRWMSERAGIGDGDFTSGDLLSGLEVPVGKQDQKAKKRVASILHGLRVKQTYAQVHGRTARVWKIPEER